MSNHDIEVQERFGNTDAYKEYEQKTAISPSFTICHLSLL